MTHQHHRGIIVDVSKDLYQLMKAIEHARMSTNAILTTAVAPISVSTILEVSNLCLMSVSR